MTKISSQMNPAALRQLIRQQAGDGKISKPDVDRLLEAAVGDGNSIPDELAEVLSEALDIDGAKVDKFARMHLERFLNIDSPELRGLQFKAYTMGRSDAPSNPITEQANEIAGKSVYEIRAMLLGDKD